MTLFTLLQSLLCGCTTLRMLSTGCTEPCAWDYQNSRLLHLTRMYTACITGLVHRCSRSWTAS